MPHKQKNPNAPHNGSPRADRKPLVLEPPPLALPVLPTTNYREIHVNEAAALRSIYGDDFEDVQNRPSAWQVSLVPASQMWVLGHHSNHLRY